MLIKLFCPNCGDTEITKKDNDKLTLKVKENSLKHPEDNNWYEKNFSVYLCNRCENEWIIEKVNE